MGNPSHFPVPDAEKTKFLLEMSEEIHRTMEDVFKHGDILKRANLGDREKECVEAIHLNTRKLSWIGNDILDFCRLGLGDVDLQSVDFNIEYLITDTVKKVSERKKVSPVEIHVNIAKDMPRHFVGDPTRLRQVVTNLIHNMLAVTSQGRIDIRARLDEDGPKDDGRQAVCIVITDSDKSIARQEEGFIFGLDAHEQLAGAEAYASRTSFGLFTCKLVAEFMGGRVDCRSEEAGHEFILRVSLPKGNALHEKGVVPLTKEQLAGKKAIIVDDSAIARKILEKYCKALGIEVLFSSESPKAVLQMLDDLADKGTIPDVVLSDLMMPEMSGYEVSEQIRANERYANVKVIAITSGVRVGAAKRAQDSGFNGFLPKPVILDELAKVVATVLGSRGPGGDIVTRHMAEELDQASGSSS